MKKENTIVYVPPGADSNIEGRPMDAPKTQYEQRKRRIDIDAVKKVVGGRYGRDANYQQS